MKYNDKHWSAEIEAYKSGKQKPSDRYELEKAALDDAFLFDALDGYSNQSEAISDREVRPAAAQQSRSWYSMRNLAVAASLLLLVGIVGYMQQQTAPSEAYADTATTDERSAPIAMTTPETTTETVVAEAKKADEVIADKVERPATKAVEQKDQATVSNIKKRESKPKAKKKTAVIQKEETAPKPAPTLKKIQKPTIDGVAVEDQMAVAAEATSRPTAALSQSDNAIAGLAMPEKTADQMSLAKGRSYSEANRSHRSSVTPPGGWDAFESLVKAQAAKLDVKLVKSVVVAFTIAADGTVTDVKATKADCMACATRAVKLITDAGKWTNITGKPYEMTYMMSI